MASWNLRAIALLLTLFLSLVCAKQYDFIVVGGGTAGLAVATRLSQYLPESSVLVIEAGPDGRDDPGIYIAGRKATTLGGRYDWNFTTVPQPGANGRTLPQNRGKVLGGSSALNLLSYDRGVEADFDAWEELGNDGWNWENMHAAMQDAETFQLTSVKGSRGIAEAGGVGYEGPINFLVNRFSPPQQELFFPTMQNLGLEQTFEFLSGKMLGWMRHTSCILGTNYTRSYAPAYLNGAPRNLHVMTDTMVAKVNFKNKECATATGVTLVDGTVIKARKEVILSAGSIQSPQLLELSGIGNSSILSAAGIEPRLHLPTVGENLQDHVRITASYQLKPRFNSPDELRLNSTYAAEQLARWENNQTGFYDETGSGYAYLQWAQAGYSQSEFVRLAEQSADQSNVVDALKLNHLKNTGLGVPQLEILFNDGYLGNKGYPPMDSPLYGEHFAGFIASVNHAYSRGHTHINSSDVNDKPLFDPMYLSNPFDLMAVASGAKYLRKIASTAPIESAFVTEYEPGYDVVKTDADWRTYAKENVATIWHPMGTCAMLPLCHGGVVDSRLKVYGTEGLRVVDASVMPILISGHIQTAVYGIAERAAHMIAEEWQR